MTSAPPLTHADRKAMARLSREQLDDAVAMRFDQGRETYADVLAVVVTAQRAGLDLDLIRNGRIRGARTLRKRVSVRAARRLKQGAVESHNDART